MRIQDFTEVFFFANFFRSKFRKQIIAKTTHAFMCCERGKKEKKRIKMLRSIVFRQILLDIYLDSSRRFGPNFQ